MSDEFTSGEIATAVKDASSEPASPAAHPAKDTGTADPTPRTSAEPSKVADDDRYKGWIPPTAHERVVDGFHKRLDALAWAQGLDPDEVREAIASRKASARQPASEAPQPDLKTEDGRFLYSAEQAAALARHEAKLAVAELRADYDKRFQPFEADRADAENSRQWMADVNSAASLPKFAEHLDDMTAFAADLNRRRAAGEQIPVMTAKDVYLAVVVPKLIGTEEQSVIKGRKAAIDDLNKTTARAHEDVNPAKVPAGSRKADRDKSFQELIAEEFGKRGAA